MKIIVETIPHHKQRYPTVGDWEWQGDNLFIRVSELGDWRYEMLVAFHEIAESLICKQRGIPESVVNEFDIEYERNRPEGDLSEPGDDVCAPYYHEHQFSTCVERLLCRELGVDWKQYDQAIGELE